MNHNAQGCEGTLRRAVTITNLHGFHMRPMQAFVELAAQYQCAVRIRRNAEEPVDGKSMWSLLSIASEKGTELVVEVEGADGPAALDALADLLANLETRVKAEET